MKLTERPVSRTAFSWLLILQLAALLPVALPLPAWLLLVSALCWVWRWAMFNGMVSPPGPWARAGLVIICVGLVLLLEGRVASLRGFALLLAFGFIFKLIELRNLRDAYMVLFTAVLLLAVNLLFSQSLVMTGLTALSLFFWLGAWVGLNQIGPELKWRQSLKWAAALYVLALPLTLALFILVPRIPPIWQISTDSGQSQTGLSDSMSPGDISNLARSDALAFRVSFSDERPAQENLYWRTVVMTRFDGRRWWQDNDYWFARSDFEIQGWAKPLLAENSQWISWPEKPKAWRGEQLNESYQIIMEPSQQHWLPSLSRPGSQTKNVGQVADQRLIYRYPIQQRIQYGVNAPKVESELTIERQLLDVHVRQYLLYPLQFNPQMQTFAKLLSRQYPEPMAFVRAFIGQIFTHNYVYTLEPPLLGEHAVDEFWFGSRRGFCAHYASALGLALRVAGIPSRVIGGYQGGEWDEDAQFLQVRQYDAHAWVEFWDHQRGWVRVDPTAAVAPHRIEQSFAQSLRAGQTEGAEAVVSWRLSNSGWLNRLRSQWDKLEYLWHKRVLNYKVEQQYALLKKWFGAVNWTYLMVGLVLLISAFLSLITLWQMKPWQRSTQPIEVSLYQELLQRLNKRGIQFPVSSPPSLAAKNLTGLTSYQQQAVEKFLSLYQQWVYQSSDKSTEKQNINKLKSWLKQV